MQHFFVEQGSIIADTVLITEPGTIHQIQKVLRMRNGETCLLLDNSGAGYECSLESVDRIAAHFKIHKKMVMESEPKVYVTLFQALPKKMELFEWILQKGAEIGVSKFVPLISKRTERDGFPKRDRLERILKEAAEQSERGKIPELMQPMSLNDVFKESVRPSPDSVKSFKILLHSRGDSPAFSTSLPEIHAKKSCEIFIGPEGGFSEEEVEFAQKSGIHIASLGARILRTETAGIVAGSLIFYS